MKSSLKDSSLKKPEDNSKLLENIRKLGSNKQCFDCGEKGTTYVVTSFGTFVCSRCAGLLRDLNYKVKGIGVCNFNDAELALLTRVGNDNARAVWLAKMDKKEKLPDPKDSEAVRKHISQKYKEKRFAVKDPEKALNGDKKESKTKNVKEASDDSDSDSDSDSDKKKKKKKNSLSNKEEKTKEVKEEPKTKPIKLAPLSMKNSNGNISSTHTQPNTQTKSPNVQKGSPNDNWANFPSATDKNNNNQGGFSFFDTPSSGGKNNFDNMFTFTDSSKETKETKPQSSEWGIVWDNAATNTNSVSNKSPDIYTTNSKGNNNTGTFDFNFVGQTNQSITQNNNQLQSNNLQMNNLNTNNQSQNQNNFPHNNNVINSNLISQNLNSVYSETNNNKNGNQRKSLEDLERALGDPNMISPMGNNPNMNNQMNMGNSNNSNNMFMMNPQMMQQMQMFMMNPQMMQNNPQMMQMFMMMQNMMAGMNQGNMNTGNTMMNQMGNMPQMNSFNPVEGLNNKNRPSDVTGLGGYRDGLNDLNFGGLNLNSVGSSIPNKENSKDDESQKPDAFKDIYNYSKSTTGTRQSTNMPNVNFGGNNSGNLNNLNNLSNQNNSSSLPNTNSNVNANPNSGYNPFDFY